MTNKPWPILVAGMLCSLSLAFLGWAPRLHAAGNVTDCSTFGPGAGTLEDALVGGGVVTFDCDGVIIVPWIVLATNTVLDASNHDVTLSGNNANAILLVGTGVSVSVVNMTLSDGLNFSGGAIFSRGNLLLTDTTVTNNTATQSGGAILNTKGSLTLVNTTISNNICCTAFSGVGGGIFSSGGPSSADLIITDSSIINNTVVLGSSGGILSFNTTATITGSTISGNIAPFTGGIDNVGQMTVGQMTVINSTISDNTTTDNTFPSGAIRNAGVQPLTLTNTTIANNDVPNAALLAGSGTVFLTNSIVSTQASGSDCVIFGGASIVSLGYNLDSDNSCALIHATDLPLGNADLLDLAVYPPGLTATHALGQNSDAIDAIPFGINNCGTSLLVDQRGVVRPQDGGCDIGAHEAVDTDADGVPDADDNCPALNNPLQTDTNDDGFGDACFDPSVDVPTNADVDRTATVGEGSTINQDVTIEADVTVGMDVSLNKGSTLEEGSTVGDGTSINKDVTVAAGANVGSGVTVSQGVYIGPGAFVGDGAFLGKDVVVCDNANVGAGGTLNRDVFVEINGMVAAGSTVAKGIVVAGAGACVVP